MAEVSYFQRYSQRENHVTNNTLLVLRHFYQTAPGKLEQVMRDLLGQDALTIGPTFEQQARGAASVPDGVISQTPFRLYFETKRGAAPGREQLERHLASISHARRSGAGGDAYLIALSTDAMASRERQAMAELAASQRVAFVAVTFSELLVALRAACQEHEAALAAILADYEAYLGSENLLFDPDDWMMVAPCGLSFDDNARFGLYYDPVDRPQRSPCAYFGAYKDKRIGLVGRITAVLACGYRDGKAVLISTERGKATPEALARISAIIEATTYYDLASEPHRYWVMDELVSTNLAKRDKGPIRNTQYLRISPLLPKDMTAKDLSARELAARLDGRAFPPIETPA